MTEGIRYVGLDTSKETIAVAYAPRSGEVTEVGAIANRPEAIRGLMHRLGRAATLEVAYEAAPTGYVIHRQLTAMGIRCHGVAPSLIPRRPGDRIKTDRRDAVQLARLLRSGDLVDVWVPDAGHEALRDLVRARDDARTDLVRAKHRLTKMLRRHGVTPPPTVRRAWSRAYETWLSSVRFPTATAQITFDECRAVVRGTADRLQRLDQALLAAGPASPQTPFIAALQALRGVGLVTAVPIAAEVGDMRRFATPRGLMAYAGLVPSEHSSGGAIRRGRLTKTGNRLLRYVLGESAHHAYPPPAIGRELARRQQGVAPAVLDLSGRCQLRLHHKYRRLSGRIGRQKAVSAVARELAGFVWAIGRAVEGPTPA